MHPRRNHGSVPRTLEASRGRLTARTARTRESSPSSGYPAPQLTLAQRLALFFEFLEVRQQGALGERP